MKSRIKYIKGDVTNPVGEGRKVIAHCVNNINVMGAGVAKAIYTKWPIVKEAYHHSFELVEPVLGEAIFIKVEEDVTVSNIFGQDGVGLDIDGFPPVRYWALEQGLNTTGHHCTAHIDAWNKYHTKTSLHTVCIGCGLAGGSWSVVEQILLRSIPQEIEIYVYDL